NDKLLTASYPEETTQTLLTRHPSHKRTNWHHHNYIILKPLDGKGGSSIFLIRLEVPTRSVIVETLTGLGSFYCLAQFYLPAFKDVVKLVLVVDVVPVPFCLSRIPIS
ncbi:glutathione synthase, partial [Erwinia amylovora]|nr:glutathione synthase [Erwinia amylovora]